MYSRRFKKNKIRSAVSRNIDGGGFSGIIEARSQYGGTERS
jgi:hypothetical protein